ncbi:helix-turn-helix domain-containing protein [Cohnella zeiphila]|uniref:Helix-turn-helix domain-containing protein n=1 Tax=Cohnella zeiphila TaxID=2761120 RepID=A0A7X0VYW4_9BACL|nr:helix-turn-helix domain-containing protein [Cohnella zeiphila]MBB6734932.1 helix-turn-helix domain-containing protein [Cohnella zeiphila]
MTRWIQERLKLSLAHTQARLALVLTVSVFLIILAVSMTSYYTSKSVLQEELSVPQHQMLQLHKNAIEEAIREIDQVAVQIAINSNIYKFLTGPEQNSYANVSAIYQMLSTRVANSPYIKSIYVYDIARGSFVSIPQGYSSSKLTFPDSEWIGVAGEFGDDVTLIKKREVPEGTGNKGSELTLFRKILIQGRFKGMIAVNLKEEELFGKLDPMAFSNVDSTRYIIDRNGEVLYSVSNYDFDQKAAGQVLASLRENERGDLTFRDRKLLVNQLESSLTGWHYVSIVSQDSLLAKSKKIRNATLWVSVAALAVGALTIFYINKAAFRPVRRLRRLFNAYGGKPKDAERADLEKLAGEVLSHHAHLSQLVRETLPEAASKYLFDVYSGQIAGRRDIREKWGRFFPNWTEVPYYAAVLSIDDYDAWSRRFQGSDHSLLKFAIANITAELFEPFWRIVCADFGGDRTALLLQPRDERAEPPQAVLAQAVDTVSRLLKFTVTAGVSMPRTDVEQIRQALLEAENAATYRLYRGYGQVVPFQEISGHETLDARPREAELEELAAAAETGDEMRSLELLERWMQGVRNDYGYPSVTLAFLHTALERLDGMETDCETERDSPERLDTLTLDDIEAKLRKRAADLAGHYRRQAESKDFVLCRRMIEYMKQHYGEPIGVPEIADAAGVSSSLASQLFKQETNETIYNYLTLLRMERASEMLRKTDRKISEVAQLVGYQHENSFIRSFRKFKDVTPGKYRDMMKTRIEATLE